MFASNIFRYTNSETKTHCLFLSIIRDFGDLRACSQDHFHCLICRLGNVYMYFFIFKTGKPTEKWIGLENPAEKHLGIFVCNMAVSTALCN